MQPAAASVVGSGNRLASAPASTRFAFCQVIPCICRNSNQQQQTAPQSAVSTPKFAHRINRHDPCICKNSSEQEKAHAVDTSAPKLPHRMSRQFANPPPIPPKSPAMNARLRALSQQQQQQQQKLVEAAAAKAAASTMVVEPSFRLQ